VLVLKSFFSKSTLTDKIYTTVKSNNHKTLLGLNNCKKFLLALIFALLNATKTCLQKLGCHTIAPKLLTEQSE
jgi:hypothetical protein